MRAAVRAPDITSSDGPMGRLYIANGGSKAIATMTHVPLSSEHEGEYTNESLNIQRYPCLIPVANTAKSGRIALRRSAHFHERLWIQVDKTSKRWSCVSVNPIRG